MVGWAVSAVVSAAVEFCQCADTDVFSKIDVPCNGS
jgi:hypothetical protein